MYPLSKSITITVEALGLLHKLRNPRIINKKNRKEFRRARQQYEKIRREIKTLELELELPIKPSWHGCSVCLKSLFSLSHGHINEKTINRQFRPTVRNSDGNLPSLGSVPYRKQGVSNISNQMNCCLVVAAMNSPLNYILPILPNGTLAAPKDADRPSLSDTIIQRRPYYFEHELFANRDFGFSDGSQSNDVPIGEYQDKSANRDSERECPIRGRSRGAYASFWSGYAVGYKPLPTNRNSTAT